MSEAAALSSAENLGKTDFSSTPALTSSPINIAVRASDAVALASELKPAISLITRASSSTNSDISIPFGVRGCTTDGGDDLGVSKHLIVATPTSPTQQGRFLQRRTELCGNSGPASSLVGPAFLINRMLGVQSASRPEAIMPPLAGAGRVLI